MGTPTGFLFFFLGGRCLCWQYSRPKMHHLRPSIVRRMLILLRISCCVAGAVPKTILQLMNVEGMTRENVASHLQKYRLYLKRIQGDLNSPDGSIVRAQRCPSRCLPQVSSRCTHPASVNVYSQACLPTRSSRTTAAPTPTTVRTAKQRHEPRKTPAPTPRKTL